MLLDSKARRLHRLPQILSLCAGLMALITVNGYIYHAVALTRVFLYTTVAGHTATALLLLSGAIFFARPRTAIAGDLTGEGSGSVMARRLLPAAFFIPILLGWIGLRGELAGLYGVESGMALYASGSVVVFAVVIWSNARKMNTEYEQRNRAEVAVHELNTSLEQRVADRTRILKAQAATLAEQAVLLDLAPDAIVVRDMDNRVLFWNRGAEAMYGWSREEAMGRDTFELLRTKFPQPKELVRAELVREGHWEGDAIQYKRDDTRLIVASRSVVQRDSTGRAVRILTSNNDVTEQRRADEALREGEERFRAMANNISQLAWMADEKGSIFWYNQRWFDYSGTTLDEMAGWGWKKIHHPDHVHRVLEKITRCFQSGEVWEDTFPLRGRNGNYRWFLSRAVPIRDAEGKVLRWFGTNTDITDRQQAEADLRLLSERLSLAAAVAKLGVWEWDLASNTGTWDSTMLEMYGFPPVASVPYEKWSGAVCSDDRPQTEVALRNMIYEKGQAILEFRIIRGDGSVRNISGACRAVLDEHASVIRVIGVNIDVTERKEVEKALEQSRRAQMRFKDEFLSHVSHEIRSPLFAIMQFTTLMLDGLAGEISQEQRDYQEIVLQNAHQMQSMVNDLLEVTRLENGKLIIEPESASVSDAVADSLNTLHGNASTGGISLSCQFSPSLPPAYADPTRLRQILIILVDNAIKFTPFGGTVKIQVWPLEKDPEFLCIEVSDTGSGIDPKKLERIFERLYQTLDDCRPSSGLGLGLFICKQLVTLQGGQIWVESELKKGSTISFTLPIFSMRKLIIPLINSNKWPAETAALVKVAVCRRDAWKSGDSQGKWSREARSLIRSCVMPNLDVLLPARSSRSEEELFFVVAFADDRGAAVLANRIREQFERFPHLIQESHNLKVSHTMLSSLAPTGMSAEDMAATLVADLEETIRFQSVLGLADHAE
jgi:PAS domain S-box-containing protein